MIYYATAANTSTMDDREKEDRFKRWTLATFSALTPIEVMMLLPARDLAQLDLDLIDMDIDVKSGVMGRILAAEGNPKRFGLSRFWVLGAYELVRTVEERFRPAKGVTPSAIHVAAVDLKHQFERLRIPLAKFEPARRHPTDWPIAYPEVNEQTGGVGWRVSHSEFIERRRLADLLLDFLEQVAAHNRGPIGPNTP